ncbi:2-succinyl-5-enolpyruvyl-6-hydroxy-3-cyclohexene-1-carboxylate synthase [Melghiribacillus thermohalophilus]|uniref:2-succinyl-5-enolpyruvyl-6-hydroxy-3-cyclohexene-1-carboxylate synthase n=1 Tax=Melghiribacillus thermohalophilus TaxID=1324956 RepID=A0A4R3MSS5_9BACI|nr:2-succinyl-5-enolpyruvyl-6-hydroxy-3-cyclohexene-1-carboxylic-acid synthase [Melghiribacillus thermohalophilus]TCT17526.1 2-succinyl-5-enolpyruvyl-6-hydroxy-3-cyclohexene-1-carboxylate synthase [Melghiribacillus thermohalophilus]
MSHQKALTYYVAHFIDELHQQGLLDVIISPGSRSTPLAMTFAEHAGIRHWVVPDERSAAFFALGMAKDQKRPVALVCTSGTAAANYYPAIVEAYYSRVPLLVLTADRPHELRDNGAPQSIDQMKMYGSYVKWFHEMAIPDDTEDMLFYARNQAQKAVIMSNDQNPGPVHMNFPFREPLIPDFSLPDIWDKVQIGDRKTFLGERTLNVESIDAFLQEIAPCRRGLLVAGPQTGVEEGVLIQQLADKWNIPVLVDPLSQLRGGIQEERFIENYDAILKDKDIRNLLKPDFIIRFSAMPISKSYLFYVKELKDVRQYVVENYGGFRDPAQSSTQYIFASAGGFAAQCMEAELSPVMDEEWTEIWIRMNQKVKEILSEKGDGLTEGNLVPVIREEMKDGFVLFAGNSMPIRDVDSFFVKTDKSIQIQANRGANGIDGVVSSAIGMAATGKRVTLLIGDVSFFHDLNGLIIARQYQIPLTVVLVNNNGGGIFSFLPQSQEPRHFERLFGTPLQLSFEHAANMYGAGYRLAETLEQFRQNLRESYTSEGIQIIEVRTDREENERWHRQIWKEISQAIKNVIR